MDPGRRAPLTSPGRLGDARSKAQDDVLPSAVPPLDAASGHVAAPESSSSLAVRGGAFTLVGHAVVQALRMVGQWILTRLLPPEAFGLMAFVHSIRGVIDLFSDIGIGPSIIQNPRGDEPRFLNTAWTIQLVRGCLLFAVTALVALPFSSFYGHAELAVLIPVASVSAMIAGFRSTKAYAAERHLALGLPTLIEIIAQGSALAVMLVWALLVPSVWALVAGGLVGAFVDVALGYVLLPGHNSRLGWDKTAAQSLMRFGKWIFLSTVLTYTVNEADRLVFGKMISLAELGVYHVALTIATIPSTAMHSLAQKVIFPLFSHVNQTGEHLAVVFRKARRLHLTLSGWSLSGLIGGGQAAIALIYDERYETGGWMLQLLALAAWFASPEATNSSASLACGYPRWVAVANFSKLVGMCILLPIGYKIAGFPGALVGYAAAEVFRYAASTVGVYQRGLRTGLQDLEFSCVVFTASVAANFSVGWLQARGSHVVVQSLVVFVLVTLIWSPWLWPYARDMLRRLEARRAS